MCDSYYLQHWQVEIINSLKKNNIQLSLVIFNDNLVLKKSFLSKIVHYKYKYLFFNLYNRFILRPKSKRAVNISSLIQDVEIILSKTIKKGYSQYFNNEDIEKIKERKLDFILRFGFNIIRGDILNSAKYGVWSFHHDDEQKYRGKGSIYKEILYNDPVNGAILQKLTSEIDAGVILKKGYFQTIKHSLRSSFDQVISNTSSWPLQVCIDIDNNVASYIDENPSKSTAPMQKVEGNFSTIRLVFRLLFNKIKFHINDLFFTERWVIGVSSEKIEEIYRNGKIANIYWLKADKRRLYYADPFVVDFDENKLLLFFEEYDYKTRKGHISSTFFNKNTKEFSPVVSALEKPYHLSFPYVFKHDGQWFLMPESAENNELNVYKIESDGSLSFYKTLLHIDAIDTILFNHDENWYLFFTRKNNSNVDLHVYFSKDIWGPYESHKNNPVKTDIRSARPAGGVFYIGNDLIRPAQNSAVYYGSKIEFNVINKLNENQFEEKHIKSIEPSSNKSFRRGIHTISSVGDFTIIDQKQHTFIYKSFAYQLKRKIRNLFFKFFSQSK